MWYYETRIGTFQIYPDPEKPGSYLLHIDNVYLGNYDSPQAAADDVYKRSTGWDAWDSLNSEEAPGDLSVWMAGKPAS
jgi:hypothetical protein